VLLHELKSADVAALSKDVPVLLPIASVEQHGPHLPLLTDSMLCSEIVRRVEERLRSRILVAPLLWLGNSHHHLDFPGTLSADPRTYLDVLLGLAENVLLHGFKRVVFFNGHGGNIAPAQQALFELRQKHRTRTDLLLLCATYWRLGTDVRKAVPSIGQEGMGHACEWETSMILRLAPNLVGDVDAVGPVPFGDPFEPADRAWITKERSAAGHVGDPRPATPEKGEALFKAFTDDAVKFLERVIAWDGKSWA
jgi:creatinine amidohydrolase